jgi:two-component system NarL family sensor kinase
MHKNPEIYFVVIIGIILGLLLVSFIIAILFLYQRRQQRQKQEMEKLKDLYEKEELRSQLEMQENTLKTISQELHDNIGQMLSVVKLSLSVLPIEKEHKAYEQIQNSQQILNKAIYDLSDLTKSLHTDRITQVGLVESIRFELVGLKKAGIVKVQFHQEGTEVEFNEQKAIFLFRIFQEVLNNILKHSGATEVIVNLKYLSDLFTLEIIDNGIGFNVAEKRGSRMSSSGVGLKSIYNRARLIGADVSLNSEPGNGTTVFIKFLIPEER